MRDVAAGGVPLKYICILLGGITEHLKVHLQALASAVLKMDNSEVSSPLSPMYSALAMLLGITLKTRFMKGSRLIKVRAGRWERVARALAFASGRVSLPVLSCTLFLKPYFLTRIIQYNKTIIQRP